MPEGAPDPVPLPKVEAADFLKEAARLVAGDRAVKHGDKHENFYKIATLWNGYWHAKNYEWADPFDAKMVGDLMELMKIARRLSGSFNMDDYIDAAGYAACTGEIAANGKT